MNAQLDRKLFIIMGSARLVFFGWPALCNIHIITTTESKGLLIPEKSAADTTIVHSCRALRGGSLCRGSSSDKGRRAVGKRIKKGNATTIPLQLLLLYTILPFWCCNSSRSSSAAEQYNNMVYSCVQIYSAHKYNSLQVGMKTLPHCEREKLENGGFQIKWTVVHSIT